MALVGVEPKTLVSLARRADQFVGCLNAKKCYSAFLLAPISKRNWI